MKQIVVGNGMDLSPLPQGRTAPYLVGSVSLLMINALFFFIAPVVLLIAIVRRRKTTMEHASMEPAKKRFHIYQLVLVLLGTVTIINNLIPVAKIMTSSFRTAAEMEPFILFNSPLFVGMIVASIFSARIMKKTDVATKKDKALYFSTLLILMSLAGLLWHWNFFTVI